MHRLLDLVGLEVRRVEGHELGLEERPPSSELRWKEASIEKMTSPSWMAATCLADDVALARLAGLDMAEAAASPSTRPTRPTTLISMP